MPSATPKQAKFMAAVGHNPAFANKVGVPQKVGAEFSKADKAKSSPEKMKAMATALRKPKTPDLDADGQ